MLGMEWTKNQTNIDAFLALVRAGLWADVGTSDFRNHGFGDSVDWNDVYQLAVEQSVQGLALQGIDSFRLQNPNSKIPQDILLQWIGEVHMIEQQNLAMNEFVAKLIDYLRNKGIYALLIKGQGVAQCYERPLWRSCGDVDLFLNNEDYKNAKDCLLPIASSLESEYPTVKHIGMTIDSWVVELHGLLRCSLSPTLNRELDNIKKETFSGGIVRTWQNGGTQVFLLRAENDVIYSFVHFLNHFYKGGIGLRQICDWCRLLWTYRESMNYGFLESRLHKMRLMTEWKAFGAFAVDYLSMPAEAIPCYSTSRKWKRKAKWISMFVMEVGNMGHNRDNSYHDKPYLMRKIYSFGRRCGDLIQHGKIFPLDSLKFFPTIVYNGLRSAVNGEG